MNPLRIAISLAAVICLLHGATSMTIPKGPAKHNATNPSVGELTRQTRNCNRNQRSILFGDRRGGVFFDESSLFPTLGPRITRIDISVGGVIDQISVSYSNGVRVSHGVRGRTEFSVTLGSDEFVTSVSGRSGDLLDQISFTTNKRTYGPFGSNGGSAFSVDFGGCALLYLFGRAGRSIDAIGFGYGPL